MGQHGEDSAVVVGCDASASSRAILQVVASIRAGTAL